MYQKKHLNYKKEMGIDIDRLTNKEKANYYQCT